MPKSKKQPVKQKELLVAVVFALVLGLGGGYALAQLTDSSDSESKTSMNEEMDSSMMHSHGSLYEVDAETAPTVELIVTEDAKMGYNIKMETTNFTFNPAAVNGANVEGEGHAHLYVGDEKIGRVYGHNYHYNGTFEGTKTFRVTLNANNHSDYAVDGKVIEAKVDVTHDSNDPDHDKSHASDESLKMDSDMHSHSN